MALTDCLWCNRPQVNRGVDKIGWKKRNAIRSSNGMYGNMVLIGTGKGEVPYLPQLLMEHNETSVKHLSYSIL